MRLAVMSDSHDNIWKIREAIPHLLQTDALIHCGDLCSPFVVKELAEPLADIPIHIVWGNNDGDRFSISKVAASYPYVHLHGALAELELGGLRIAVNHYPEIAMNLARSQSFDLVCYGHDHIAHTSWLDEVLLLNPGEMMGMQGTSQMVIVETEGRDVQPIMFA